MPSYIFILLIYIPTQSSSCSLTLAASPGATATATCLSPAALHLWSSRRPCAATAEIVVAIDDR